MKLAAWNAAFRILYHAQAGLASCILRNNIAFPSNAIERLPWKQFLGQLLWNEWTGTFLHCWSFCSLTKGDKHSTPRGRNYRKPHQKVEVLEFGSNQNRLKKGRVQPSFSVVQMIRILRPVATKTLDSLLVDRGSLTWGLNQCPLGSWHGSPFASKGIDSVP